MTKFYEAFEQLETIEYRSLIEFGNIQTDKYMTEIYQDFKKIANTPSLDNHRLNISKPFFMQPAGTNHFAIYNRFDDYIIIGIILAQEMSIEERIEKVRLRVERSIEKINKKISKN